MVQNVESINTFTNEKESETYQKQYSSSFVDKWDELIDWDSRRSSEGDFFIRSLKETGAKKILDVATGTGFHSVSLIREGFCVHSLDGNANMLQKAFENAKRQGIVLRTIQSDWRWLSKDIHEKYDAIICLGNSFTHLFDEKDRIKALAEFYSVLKFDGTLVIDQRNYDVILNRGFKTKHTYYYAGEGVKAEPIKVNNDLTIFRYEFKDDSVFHLNMYPLRKEYVVNLLTMTGFMDVKTFGDFKETYHDDDPDYLIHVAKK
jgi:glycine/sarcosine N-methyltransferase